MEDYIKNEIILRNMSLDSQAKIDLDSLTKWLILALGIGNPKSKPLVFLFKKLLEYRFREKYFKITELPSHNYSIKTLYYHLNRLQKMGLVKKTSEGYLIGETLKEPVKEFLLRYYKNRINEAFKTINEALDSFKTKTLL